MARNDKIKSPGVSHLAPKTTHTPEQMGDMANALGLLVAGGALSEAELREVHNLLEELSGYAEIRVRAAVSRAISEYPLLPPSLAQQLAQDVLEVAGPILESSPALSDEFLISQIEDQGTEEEAQIKIARRNGLSVSVTYSILQSGAVIAAETVLTNATAEIADDGLEALLRRDDLSGNAMMLVAARDGLSQPIVSQCHEILLADHFDREFGHQARKLLIEKHALPPEMANTIVKTALEDALTRATTEAGSPEQDLELLAEHLNAHNDLTASLVLRMVCTGSVEFAKAAYRVRTKRSREEIAVIFLGAGTDALGELYLETGLDPYLRFAVTVAIKRMVEEHNKTNKSVDDKPVRDIIREIVGFYRGIAPASIEQVIANLCHEADRWRNISAAPTPQPA